MATTKQFNRLQQASKVVAHFAHVGNGRLGWRRLLWSKIPQNFPKQIPIREFLKPHFQLSFIGYLDEMTLIGIILAPRDKKTTWQKFRANYNISTELMTEDSFNRRITVAQQRGPWCWYVTATINCNYSFQGWEQL